MDYLFLLAGSLFKLDFESSWVVAVALIVFFKLVGGQSLYLLFFVFLGFCYVGLLFLWKGFTFNFLILFILYSTVFIIFWIFLIAFGDLQLKRELSQRNYTPVILLFVYPLLSAPWNSGVFGASMAAEPAKITLWLSNSSSELSVLYSYLYDFHLELTFLLFGALLIACLSVVTILLIRASWKTGDAAGSRGVSNQNGSQGFRRVFFSNPTGSGPSLASIRG